MKTKPGVGHLELKEVEVVAPGPGEVLVDVHATGICGTDLHIIDDEYGHKPPVVLGHEVIGTVTELGEGVERSWLGERIACETFFSTCEVCAPCRDGRPNLCKQRVSIGSGIDGGFTSRMRIPARNLHSVPPGVEDYAASLLEPLACVVNCLCDPSVVNAGDRVLVTGPGPIGMLAAMVARASGGEVTVAGLAKDADRLAVAERLGFGALGDDSWQGEEFAVTVECSGSAGGVAACLRSTERGGRLVVIGLAGREVSIPFDEVCYRELTVTSGFASIPRSWRRSLALLGEGAVDLGALVSRAAPLGEWEDAIAEVRAGQGMKVVFDPRL
ncbi:MAG TPA: alcohol dehydrogenase catalytic domain-containing protein [Solirubrobacterales bacterium]